jgi:hypothetical protein
MKIITAFTLGLVLSGWAAAAERYQCEVYCKAPDGKIKVSIQADGKEDAARKIDRESDQLCRRAGHDRSTSQSMSASQCRRD